MNLEEASDRTRTALSAVDLNGRGLEIGPSYNPLVPKSSGARIETVDHAGRDELVAKYAEWGLDKGRLDSIEPVDHLWSGGSLLDAVPERGVYDYIVAAHFIEHTVDMVRFLKDCAELLTSSGRLALIVPDKRYCFDRFRPISTLGDVLEAHYAGKQFHTLGSMVDHQAYACKRGDLLAWGEGEVSPLEVQFAKLEGVADAVRDGIEQKQFRDSHRWVFTPASFHLLMNDLAVLGHHKLGTVTSADTVGFEFFVTLGKDAPILDVADRLDALLQVEKELAAVSQAPVRNRMNALEAELAAAKSSAAAANDAVAQQHETVASMQALIDAQLTALSDLHSSTSWKLTRPVRAMSRLLRR